MGNHFKIAFISIFIVLFASAGVLAADAVKIGLVDFQKVLDNSVAGKAAQEEVNRKGMAMEAELRKMGEEIEQIKNQLEREALVMSQEAREEKEREIRIKVGDFKTMQNRHMQEFKEAERELVAKIQKEVVDLVRKVGAEQGYTLILERRESGAVYFKDPMDITNQIIDAYDKKANAGN
jgi:outer membrane protein